MVTRKEILEMLSNGAIDVDQATKMLNAAGAAEAEMPPHEAGNEGDPALPVEAPEPDMPAKPKRKKRRWLHIHVSDLDTGRKRVRVNVPLGLVNFGLRFGARFTDELDADMTQDVLDALRDEGLTGTLVEVEDVEDNERVHIFVD